LNNSATRSSLSDEINEIKSNEWKNLFPVNISGNTNNSIHSYLSSNVINSKNNQFKLGSSNSLSVLNNSTFSYKSISSQIKKMPQKQQVYQVRYQPQYLTL
jgi:hypothetical protein